MYMIKCRKQCTRTQTSALGRPTVTIAYSLAPERNPFFKTLYSYLRGVAGRPPFGGLFTRGDPEGGGAGLMGRDMMFWPLEALEVLAGYAGRGGAPAPLVSAGVDVSRLEDGGDRSRSFSRISADGAGAAAR
jgi:hypothetical protein